MTSTADLISQIPEYMVEELSVRILGAPIERRRLAERLGDEKRLRGILEGLTGRQRSLMLDLYEMGGRATWEVLAAARSPDLEGLVQDLTVLGGQGIAFQGGLSRRDEVILLPAVHPLLEELRRECFGDPGEFTWREGKGAGIARHVALLNAFRVSKIRCRSGMEPFKRGWQFLEERLGPGGDISRLYWELVELGCIREIEGVLALYPKACSELAAEGDARYPVWRFIRSCRPYPNLDHKVLTLIADRAIRKDHAVRALTLFILAAGPGESRAADLVRDLIGQWLDLGVLEQDVSGGWLRLSPQAFRALKSGRVEVSLQGYGEEVVIQPDMEILVPGDFDPVDLLDLGGIADIVRTDVMSIYRITRKSISRGIRSGWDADGIMAFLRRISRHGLPENVEKTVRGWVLAHSEAHLLRGTFLVMPPEAREVPGGIVEVLPGIFRVPREREAEVLNFLEKNDIVVRGALQPDEAAQGASWGKMVPSVPAKKGRWKDPSREGVFPFGMVTPLPYGAKGEEIFQQALQDGRTVVIFYPKQGYGEVQAKKISPISLFRQGGVPFVEAFCEDTGEGETFDITRIRGLLMNRRGS